MLTILADRVQLRFPVQLKALRFGRTSAITFIERPDRFSELARRNLSREMVELVISKRPNCRAWRNFRHYVILTGF